MHSFQACQSRQGNGTQDDVPGIPAIIGSDLDQGSWCWLLELLPPVATLPMSSSKLMAELQSEGHRTTAGGHWALLPAHFGMTIPQWSC